MLINVESLELLLLTVLHFGILSCGSPHYRMEIERNEMIKGEKETLVDLSNIKTIRTKDRERCLNGTFTLAEDIDDSYMLTIKVSVSSSGSSNFVELPTQFNLKQSLCVAGKPHYEKWLQPTMKDISNFPLVTKNAEWCPISQGTYHVKCLRSIITDGYPDHMRHGLYNVGLSIFKKDQLVGGIIVYFRVYPKLE